MKNLLASRQFFLWSSRPRLLGHEWKIFVFGRMEEIISDICYTMERWNRERWKRGKKKRENPLNTHFLANTLQFFIMLHAHVCKWIEKGLRRKSMKKERNVFRFCRWGAASRRENILSQTLYPLHSINNEISWAFARDLPECSEIAQFNSHFPQFKKYLHILKRIVGGPRASVNGIEPCSVLNYRHNSESTIESFLCLSWWHQECRSRRTTIKTFFWIFFYVRLHWNNEWAHAEQYEQRELSERTMMMFLMSLKWSCI